MCVSNHMHTTHGGHRYEIEKETTELGIHFDGVCWIIDCVKEGMRMSLIQLEGVCQNRLVTFNIHDNINRRNEKR